MENTPKPSKLRTRLAITTPSEQSPKASRNISPSPCRMSAGMSVISAKRASASTSEPWNMATVVPPRIFPSSTVARGSGDTRISRRKPNSRSQIVDTADCTEV